MKTPFEDAVTDLPEPIRTHNLGNNRSINKPDNFAIFGLANLGNYQCSLM